MSEDLNKKIQQIAELLGQESMPDNVKELVSLLAGPQESKTGTDDKPVEIEQTKDEKSQKTQSEDNTEMLRKVKKVVDKLNTGNNDPRVNLLYAIKPFMNNKRQKKISDCIQLLQMASVTKLMNDHEK